MHDNRLDNLLQAISPATERARPAPLRTSGEGDHFERYLRGIQRLNGGPPNPGDRPPLASRREKRDDQAPAALDAPLSRQPATLGKKRPLEDPESPAAERESSQVATSEASAPKIQSQAPATERSQGEADSPSSENATGAAATVPSKVDGQSTAQPGDSTEASLGPSTSIDVASSQAVLEQPASGQDEATGPFAASSLPSDTEPGAANDEAPPSNGGLPDGTSDHPSSQDAETSTTSIPNDTEIPTAAPPTHAPVHIAATTPSNTGARTVAKQDEASRGSETAMDMPVEGAAPQGTKDSAPPPPPHPTVPAIDVAARAAAPLPSDDRKSPRTGPLGERLEGITSAMRRLDRGAGGAPGIENQNEPRIDPSRFVERVTKAFQSAQDRGGPITLRLSPAELGSLRLELTVKDGAMTATVETDSDTARRALLEHLPTLRERLAEQNIRIERFDVDIRREGENAPRQQGSLADGRDHQDSQGRSERPATTSATAEIPRTAAQITVTETQLNLFA